MKLTTISSTIIIFYLFFDKFETAKESAKEQIKSSEDTPELPIGQGLIKGKYWRTRLGRRIRAFLGLRYAKPPIGELRFKAPVRPDPWFGIYQATKTHPVCPQRDVFRRDGIIEGDEDCLFLNVYTPDLVETTELLPIMVFIHGGGYLAGSGNLHYYGPDFLLDKDIVLVVINYRLGVLGFLATGDLEAPGNLGLKDQTMALRWIKDNIKYFGGNPDSVTIFGESAGGASVNLHMLSPLSGGLFHRGISQSGTLHCPWAFISHDRVIKHTRKLAKIFNCNSESSREILACLRHIHPLEMVAKDVEFMTWDYDPLMPFGPVIEPQSDQAFIDKDPRQDNYQPNVPWMIGATTNEGALRVASLYSNKTLLHEYNENFYKLAPISLLFDDLIADSKLAAYKLKQFYFGDKSIDDDTKAELVDLYSDGLFIHGINEGAEQFLRTANNSKLYFYLFSYRGSVSFTRLFGDSVEDYGVCHADDLQYLFPVGREIWPQLKQSPKDHLMIDLLTTLWTNFAKFGDPTPKSDGISPKWLPVFSDKIEYYNIDGKGVEMKHGLYRDRVEFWKRLYSNEFEQNSKNEL